MIVGIDTSLPVLSIALIEERKIIAALALYSEGSRNEKLLPNLDWLLTESGRTIEEVELFAVTRGPGSFTGVRVALATVQGMAAALERPICAMSTHEAVIHGTGRELVHSDAGRGEFYATLFDEGREVAPTHLVTPTELEELKREPGHLLDLSAESVTVNVAVRLAQAALRIREAGRLSDYADPTPLYVRLAEADVKLQQKQNAAL